MMPTAGFSGILEIIGWSGRLWSSKNVHLKTPFLTQITGCIIGPTPLLAANFIIFGTIIQRLGTGYSRLSPKWYTIVFCSCDAISLIVQAIGGAKASQAADNDDRVGARKGGNIMLGGIVFQLCVIIVFSIVATEFLVRYFRRKPINSEVKFERGPLELKLKFMIGALVFNLTCLFIRAVYRTAELSEGWDGRIISTQVYFNVLDGGMVTLAIFTLNMLHPGLLLRSNTESGSGIGEKEKAVDSIGGSSD